jgi:hypothetical protein
MWLTGKLCLGPLSTVFLQLPPSALETFFLDMSHLPSSFVQFCCHPSSSSFKHTYSLPVRDYQIESVLSQKWSMIITFSATHRSCVFEKKNKNETWVM